MQTADTVVETQPFDIQSLLDPKKSRAPNGQQLALDAARLLNCTAERFEEYKNAGFFKRFWLALTGKNAAAARANQNDLAEVQRYALIYLNGLQEQNLLQAQAIAVIRNNLKDLACVAAQNREAIIALIGRFDGRIRRLENNSLLLKWRTSIEIKGYNSEQRPLHRMLAVVFDYVRLLQDNNIEYNESDVREDIGVALKKLSVDGRLELSVREFAAELFGEIGVDGIESYGDMIELRVEGVLVGSGFILDNVTGVGYATIYIVGKEVPRITELLSDLGNTSEEQKALVPNLLGKRLPNPDTRYTLLELACEILAGSMIADEVYREQNGLAPKKIVHEPPVAENFCPESLVGEYINIKTHAFFESKPSLSEAFVYLTSFSVLFAEMQEISAAQLNYVKSLNKLFACESCIDSLCHMTQHRRIDVAGMLNLLNTPERKYAWLIDAVFLGCMEGELRLGTKNIIEMISKGMDVKTDLLSSIVNNSVRLSTSKDKNEVFRAIQVLGEFSMHWKTVIDYRKFSFAGFVEELDKEINQCSLDANVWSIGITSKIFNCQMKCIDLGCVMGDENFLQKAALAVARRLLMSDLRDIEKHVADKVSALRGVARRANDVVAAFGLKRVNFPSSVWVSVDEDISYSNGAWSASVEKALSYLGDLSSGMCNALNEFSCRLEDIKRDFY